MIKLFNAIYSLGFTLAGFGLFGTGEEVAGSICLLGAMYTTNKLWEEDN